MNKRIPQVTRVAKALGLARLVPGGRKPEPRMLPWCEECQSDVVLAGGRWYRAATTRVCPHA